MKGRDHRQGTAPRANGIEVSDVPDKQNTDTDGGDGLSSLTRKPASQVRQAVGNHETNPSTEAVCTSR